jgi:hypothetical protein
MTPCPRPCPRPPPPAWTGSTSPLEGDCAPSGLAYARPEPCCACWVVFFENSLPHLPSRPAGAGLQRVTLRRDPRGRPVACRHPFGAAIADGQRGGAASLTGRVYDLSLRSTRCPSPLPVRCARRGAGFAPTSFSAACRCAPGSRPKTRGSPTKLPLGTGLTPPLPWLPAAWT